MNNGIRIVLIVSMIFNGAAILIEPNGRWALWNLLSVLGCAAALIINDRTK